MAGVFEVEDFDFGAIHPGQGRLEPADRGREGRVPGHPDDTAAAVAVWSFPHGYVGYFRRSLWVVLHVNCGNRVVLALPNQCDLCDVPPSSTIEQVERFNTTDEWFGIILILEGFIGGPDVSHDAELLHPHGNKVVEEAFMYRLNIRHIRVSVRTHKCHVRRQRVGRLDW